MYFNKIEIIERLKRIVCYAVTFLKWLLLSLAAAAVCGGAGCLFHLLIENATEFRESHGFIVYFLPLGGMFIVFLYHIFKLEKIDGTNYVISSIRKEGRVPFTMAPGILIATVLTHMLGGSAGREGAALQLGGSLGSSLGRIFRLDDKDMHVIVLCGMSAVFTSLFGTPLTAVIFVMEVISVGVIYYSAIMPCMFSAIFTYYLSLILGTNPTSYKLSTIPEMTPQNLLRCILLGIIFAGASIFLCICFSKGGALIHKAVKNDYLRVALGGAVIVILTLTAGLDYSGAGSKIIDAAILEKTARPEAFILKILFTSITLGCGFKGGEIVPTFFAGASLGCVVAPLVGIDPGFGAALGLVGVFCGATNAPIASMVLSIELFGADGLPYYAIICSTSFMLSGYYSLYKSQIIVYDKLKAIFINRKTK